MCIRDSPPGDPLQGPPDSSRPQAGLSRARKMAKDCADCGSEDCGLELVVVRCRGFGPPRPRF
eukprot:10091447-Alexandrium_andersonii.AAC.1